MLSSTTKNYVNKTAILLRINTSIEITHIISIEKMIFGNEQFLHRGSPWNIRETRRRKRLETRAAIGL
jgi:hypothetical protein